MENNIPEQTRAHVKISDENGDACLSPLETKLWDLTYHCILKLKCRVMFRIFGPDVRNRIDLHIRFFVDRNNPNKEAVKLFLKGELEVEVRNGKAIKLNISQDEETYVFGCIVDILEYSGPSEYTEFTTNSSDNNEDEDYTLVCKDNGSHELTIKHSCGHFGSYIYEDSRISKKTINSLLQSRCFSCIVGGN